MTDISLRLSQARDFTDSGDGGRSLRVLLAGECAVAWSERRLHLERLLAAASGDIVHKVLPVGRQGNEAAEAQRQLERGMADVVLLDLGGPISHFLTLVGSLRASAGPRVVFIGLYAGDHQPATAAYRHAVVDAVLYSCSSGAVLQRGIADALETILDCEDASFGAACMPGTLRQ